MKGHVTASAISFGRRNEGGAVKSTANRSRAPVEEDTRTQNGSGEPGLVLRSVSARTHTLVLTGELDYRSAHALESEIERLCDEGVTGITLDLRELTFIDSIGVAVIAFRCRLCKRRGFDFAVIPGGAMIRRAFEQAGVTDLLPIQEEDTAPPRLPALALGHRSRDGCEQ
jgi:anti-anti-sigma factor